MNSSYVESLSADNEAIKSQIDEILKGIKEKTISQQEAHLRMKCMDGLLRVVTTKIHLDGIKQAIKRTEAEAKQPQVEFRGSGKYEKIRR